MRASHAPASAPLVVGIGGTLRPGSRTEQVLRAALTAVERRGARTVLVAGAALDLPMYAPPAGERSAAARTLVDRVAQADGVIVASPAYHGGVSGLVKNALDHVEDLRDASRPYLDGRAVGCIACAGGWQAAAATLTGLRSIVHALRGWPTPLGVALNTSDPVFGADGALVDATALAQLEIVADQVVSFARRHAGAGARRHDDRLPLIRRARPLVRTHPSHASSAKEPT
ncbi:MAG TPA: NADPH-dependent FMN reductase [Solirubrobacteraceae bacterium]|nr:NADPH-dependent FMN reductase [Solirubrobacteraceae bacterium]